MSPQRIQRQRTAGWRLPEGAVMVSRPARWGNPWRVHYLNKEWVVRWQAASADAPPRHLLLTRFATRAEAQQAAAAAFVAAVQLGLDGFPTLAQIRTELAGKDLACWCGIGLPCHGDWLLDTANQPETSH